MPRIDASEINNELIPSSKINDAIRNDAVKEVLKDQAISGKRMNTLDFIKEVSKKFIEKQLDAFPMICDVARYQHAMKQKELAEIGRKGRFTDSLGWSEGYEFKHEFDIPQELHLFMVNLVYKDFWSEENERVWRKFMRLILTGNIHTDMETLMWAKGIYGSNSQKTLITTS